MPPSDTIQELLRDVKRAILLVTQKPNLGEAYVAADLREHNAWKAWSEDHSHAGRPMPSILPASELPPDRYTAMFPAEAVENKRYPGIPDWAWRHFQSRRVEQIGPYGAARLDNARVYGATGLAETKDGFLLGDIWQDSEYPIGYFWNDMAALPQNMPVRLGGVSVVIAMPWLPNYYHFRLQVVPRIEIALKTINRERIDHWIVPKLAYSYEKSLLAAAGVPVDKMVEADRQIIECEHLVVPTIPCFGGYVPAWASHYTASLVKPDSGVPVREKVFVRRVKTITRKLSNERQVAQLLHSKGYEPISMDSLTLEQQAAVFRNAREIVGVHGAALANLIHTQPGAKLVELLPANYVSPYFMRISSMLGLDYAPVIGTEWCQPTENYVQLQRADMSISVEELAAAL